MIRITLICLTLTAKLFLWLKTITIFEKDVIILRNIHSSVSMIPNNVGLGKSLIKLPHQASTGLVQFRKHFLGHFLHSHFPYTLHSNKVK